MNLIQIFEMVVAVSLVGVILMQSSKGGLSRQIGVGAYHARRGLEKILFYATIILSITFALLALFDAIY